MFATALNARRVDVTTDANIRDEGLYSARNSSKGALIEEAGRLFGVVASGESLGEVRDQVLRGTLLSQRSTENRKKIWTLLHWRYLAAGIPWLTQLLAENSAQDIHSPSFTSMLYLLYALRDRLTFDFVTTVLFTKRQSDRPVISRNDVLDLLRTASLSQPQIDRWSESTRTKLAGSILTALRDFGLLEGKQKKTLVRPPLPLSTAAVILRILIAEGCRGRQVLEDHIWRLFLLSEADVAQVLARLAQGGTIRFEKAGSTVVLETPAEWEHLDE
jgi:hypothetical protein